LAALALNWPCNWLTKIKLIRTVMMDKAVMWDLREVLEIKMGTMKTYKEFI
jgi:hypothetical protein